MAWFSKKTNKIEEVSKIFSDQFPTWAVQHATKLVQELKSSEDENEKNCANLIRENQSAEKILIDCLTGAHATYLKFDLLELPEGVSLLLGGEKKIVQAISKWSERSKDFFIVASTFHERSSVNNQESAFIASIEKMFGGGKLEPLAVNIGTLITKEIEKELNKELGPFFIAGLYRIIFQLGQEQRDWLSDEVIEKAKK